MAGWGTREGRERRMENWEKHDGGDGLSYYSPHFPETGSMKGRRSQDVWDTVKPSCSPRLVQRAVWAIAATAVSEPATSPRERGTGFADALFCGEVGTCGDLPLSSTQIHQLGSRLASTAAILVLGLKYLFWRPPVRNETWGGLGGKSQEKTGNLRPVRRLPKQSLTKTDSLGV